MCFRAVFPHLTGVHICLSVLCDDYSMVLVNAPHHHNRTHHRGRVRVRRNQQRLLRSATPNRPTVVPQRSRPSTLPLALATMSHHSLPNDSPSVMAHAGRRTWRCDARPHRLHGSPFRAIAVASKREGRYRGGRAQLQVDAMWRGERVGGLASMGGNWDLGMLCPFQLLYSDGV